MENTGPIDGAGHCVRPMQRMPGCGTKFPSVRFSRPEEMNRINPGNDTKHHLSYPTYCGSYSRKHGSFPPRTRIIQNLTSIRLLFPLVSRQICISCSAGFHFRAIFTRSSRLAKVPLGSVSKKTRVKPRVWISGFGHLFRFGLLPAPVLMVLSIKSLIWLKNGNQTGQTVVGSLL